MCLFLEFLETSSEPKWRIKIEIEAQGDLAPVFSCAGTTCRLCAGCSAPKIARSMCALRSPSRKLELELIQTQMAQTPTLRAELHARALRASQNAKRENDPCAGLSCVGFLALFTC